MSLEEEKPPADESQKLADRAKELMKGVDTTRWLDPEELRGAIVRVLHDERFGLGLSPDPELDELAITVAELFTHDVDFGDCNPIDRTILELLFDMKEDIAAIKTLLRRVIADAESRKGTEDAKRWGPSDLMDFVHGPIEEVPLDEDAMRHLVFRSQEQVGEKIQLKEALALMSPWEQVVTIQKAVINIHFAVKLIRTGKLTIESLKAYKNPHIKPVLELIARF